MGFLCPVHREKKEIYVLLIVFVIVIVFVFVIVLAMFAIREMAWPYTDGICYLIRSNSLLMAVRRTFMAPMGQNS